MPVNSAGWHLRRLADGTEQLVQPAVPFVIHGLASAATFTVSLAAAQCVGMACRVSCATPVLGPGFGLIGVGIASAMAGQAGLHCRHHFQTGQHPLRLPASFAFRRQDLLLDACLGITLYKMMGGRFRSIMPSDLFKPGAMARESLRAPGRDYASTVNREELQRLMRRDGCHHCGKRKGRTIGDHMPPNKMVFGSSKQLTAEVKAQVKAALGVPAKPAARHLKPKVTTRQQRWSLNLKRMLGMDQPIAQRYYPQCTGCCQKQAHAVKSDKRTFVLHMGGPKPWFYAGVMIGLRHYHNPAAASALLLSDKPGRSGFRGGFADTEDDDGDHDLPGYNSTQRSNARTGSDRQHRRSSQDQPKSGLWW